jgi:hypothetical protein
MSAGSRDLENSLQVPTYIGYTSVSQQLLSVAPSGRNIRQLQKIAYTNISLNR